MYEGRIEEEIEIIPEHKEQKSSLSSRMGYFVNYY